MNRWRIFLHDCREVLICLALALAIIVLARAMLEVTCDDYADMTGRETRVSYMTCYVKVDGEWHDRKHVRGSRQ